MSLRRPSSLALPRSYKSRLKRLNWVITADGPPPVRATLQELSSIHVILLTDAGLLIRDATIHSSPAADFSCSLVRFIMVLTRNHRRTVSQAKHNIRALILAHSPTK